MRLSSSNRRMFFCISLLATAVPASALIEIAGKLMRRESTARRAAPPEQFEKRLRLPAPPTAHSDTPEVCVATGKTTVYHIETSDPYDNAAMHTCHQGCAASANINDAANNLWKTAGFKVGTCLAKGYDKFKHNAWDEIFIGGSVNIAGPEEYAVGVCNAMYKNRSSNVSGVVTKFCEQSCSHLLGDNFTSMAGYLNGHCNSNATWGHPYKHYVGEKTIAVYVISTNQDGSNDTFAPAVMGNMAVATTIEAAVHNDTLHVNEDAIGNAATRRRALRRRRENFTADNDEDNVTLSR